MTTQIPVLCGSETGNAEYCAEMLVNALREHGHSAEVIDMEDFDPQALPGHPLVFIVTSTYGNGGPPSNAERLLESLQTETFDLSKVRFAVCGLGSTTFDNFAQCGKDFEAAMLRGGASRVFDRVDCDDDFEEAYEGFQATAIAYVNKHASELATQTSASQAPAQAQAAPSSEPRRWSRDNPALVPVVSKRLLSRAGSRKETMHYELDLSGTGFEFEVGDCFGLHALNGDAEIQAVLSAAGLRGDELVSWNKEGTDLRTALSRTCLAQVTGPFLTTLTALDSCRSGSASAALAKGEDAFRVYRKERHVVDVLAEHQVRGLRAQAFVDSLRKLQPRLFSVASPSRNLERVAFTIETVRYRWNDRAVRGVATCWLADSVNIGDKVPVYLVPNHDFRFPRDERPVIMVGPGTGIAPFRGYLAEVEASAIRNHTWLFFGHQHKATDFLYQEELAAWFKSGVLNRADFAWSRDQDEKVYVQHKLIERGADLWAWLQNGAEVFVCGDAERMAPAVAHAFQTIAETVGQTNGKAFLDGLIAAGRYKTDVY